MKVTPTQIRAAMEQCEGCVAKAAVILGLARPNLYKRLAKLGIDPNDYRRRRGNTVASAQATPTVTATQAARATAARTGSEESGGVAHSSPVILTPKAPGRIVTHVTSASSVATASSDVDEQPKKLLRMTRSFYLRPDQVKAIDDACLDLPAVLREQMSPSKVMERFMDDCFAGWLARAMGAPAPPRRKKKAGTE